MSMRRARRSSSTNRSPLPGDSLRARTSRQSFSDPTDLRAKAEKPELKAAEEEIQEETIEEVSIAEVSQDADTSKNVNQSANADTKPLLEKQEERDAEGEDVETISVIFGHEPTRPSELQLQEHGKDGKVVHHESSLLATTPSTDATKKASAYIV